MNRTISALAFCILGCIAHAASPDLSRLLPDNTIIVLQAPSMPALLQAYDASPLRTMIDDPAAAQIVNPAKKAWSRAESRVIARDAVTGQQWRAFATGQAMLAAMARTDGSKKRVQWVLLVEHGGQPQVMAALKAGPKPKGGARLEKRNQPAGALTFTRLRIVREVRTKIPGAASDGMTALKQEVDEYDEYLGPTVTVFGPAQDGFVRQIVERLSRIQSGEKIGAPAVFSAASNLKSAGQAQLLVDFGKVAELLGKPKSKKKPLDMLMFDPRALGLDGVRGAASFDIQPDRLGAEAVVRAPEHRAGAAKIIMMADPLTTSPAALVPPDAVAYGALGYPLGEGWKSIRELLAAASPATAVTLNLQIDAIRQATGVDLDSALMAGLGNTLVRFLWEKNGGKTPFQQSTFALRLKDENAGRIALEAVVAHLSQGIGLYQVERQEYLGRRLWGLRPGRPGVVSNAEPQFWLAIDRNWAIGGVSDAGVREVLRRIDRQTSDSLAENAQFRAAMAGLPTARQGEWFIDVAAVSRVFEMTPPIKNIVGQIEIDPVLPKEAGFGPLWGRYFQPIAATRVVEGNRMRIEARCLKK